MDSAKAATVEFSIPLPRSVDHKIYIRLTTQSKAILVFLTTAGADEPGTPTPMGSLVYALPDVCASLRLSSYPSISLLPALLL